MSGHKAPRAVATSDVSRPRRLLAAAMGGAVGSALSLLACRTPPGTSRDVARPHAVASVGCASCHQPERDATFAGKGACETCHGSASHPPRAAHARVVASGALTCATCHPAHAGAQGVTFAEGAVWRWATGTSAVDVSRTMASAPTGVRPGTTFPLVAAAACATCHDVTSAGDPVARCIPASVREGATPERLRTTPIACLDEHRAPSPRASDGPAAPSAGTKCAAQHARDRFVADEAARAVAISSPWLGRAPDPGGSPWAPFAGGALGAVALSLGLVAVEGRGRRRLGGRETLPLPTAATPAARRRLPMIDPSTCLGCQACVDACPFDVLAIDRYVAVVARPDECCGAVLCAQVCPNGSLRIAEGDVDGDRPAFDAHLESTDVPGVYLAGDLTGMPLVKNAIRQGVGVVDRIAETLPRRRGRDVDADVLVVGAGPAGLAAALRAREKGLSCVVVEQATLAASIKSFPRDKIVHDPPLHLPVEGELWLRESTKEELVAQWTRIVRTRALDVREGLRLTGLAHGASSSPVGPLVATVEAAGGAAQTLRADRVVLAIGRRGTPRTLDLALRERADEHVHYALADARSFAGKRVLVVGLGDAALEAIVALARQPGTEVTVSYRGAGFTRGKARNVEEVRALAARGRVRMCFDTVPVAFEPGRATLRTGAGSTRTVDVDAVVALLGGEPAWRLLEKLGLRRPTPAAPAPATAPDPLPATHVEAPRVRKESP